MAENEMFICLVLYTSSDAFNGQYNNRHHDSFRTNSLSHDKRMILCINLHFFNQKMLTIIKVDATFMYNCPHRSNSELHRLLIAAE